MYLTEIIIWVSENISFTVLFFANITLLWLHVTVLSSLYLVTLMTFLCVGYILLYSIYVVVKQVHLAVAWCCYRRQLCIFSPSQVSSQKYIGQCATMIFHLCRTKLLWYHKSIDELTLVLKQFNWNLVNSRRFACWVWLEMKTRKFFTCFSVLYLPYIALSIIHLILTGASCSSARICDQYFARKFN